VKEHAEALFRIGEWVAANGVDTVGRYRAGRDLLLRKQPRLASGETLEPLAGEEPKSTACRIVSALEDSVFAIQGPPGAGKTFTGARMICELVKEGKKIGITALSHKVIRKLLDEVVDAAKEQEQDDVRYMQRSDYRRADRGHCHRKEERRSLGRRTVGQSKRVGRNILVVVA